MEKKKPYYAMATKATWGDQDISRDKPDLCIVDDEDEENYIGKWVTGIGFFNVKFPKSTTRELTEEEKKKYHGRRVFISGKPIGGIINLNEGELSEYEKQILRMEKRQRAEW